MGFYREIHPPTQIVMGIILLIIGACVIIIGPTLPQEPFHYLQKFVFPGLFYSIYFLLGGIFILMGAVALIVGLIYRHKGY